MTQVTHVCLNWRVLGQLFSQNSDIAFHRSLQGSISPTDAHHGRPLKCGLGGWCQMARSYDCTLLFAAAAYTATADSVAALTFPIHLSSLQSVASVCSWHPSTTAILYRAVVK